MKKALTIAGSDSGGGAGIQADLKTFQELEVYGMSVITAVTAQNTRGVQGVFPLGPEAVSRQLESIAGDMGTDALKTGMLFDSGIIEVAAEKIKTYRWEKLVVDPVIIAKGGETLLQKEAVQALKSKLLPLAFIVTPNLPEAEELAGMPIRNAGDRKEAARIIADCGPRYVLIKGGHNASSPVSSDLLFDGVNFYEYTAKRYATKNTHGTGCTFSSAITAELAKGADIFAAVSTAKAFISAAIEDGIQIGHGHGPTNHWAYQKRRMKNG
ncbi:MULTISPECIES: bifunctional hydroxymethylpyrimidine kinase/phosphomethylpyrimidine kinase [Heyndrickxia]|uniref:Hydroxymethylpyrimidine/phosphomethylpyrimidine kinase n=3 Tax=Bacillota TaxID=1239 RepID=A0A150K8N5_HEYCO|nr:MULTISPECIES: bifunctional hydroxymethylpyrimidine kinase/phosphomethylpyrimidine kinase [Heyndrickxia]AEH53442.1 phosphomethylpyrimidine kinase [Heyndrickxia coagulans 2-6]AJH78820.1 hydroxymethylpyrimidine kinase/phosphomethylpyrimidine kinase [Heyndrickxia coagulans DSM 1 = ATCC 7050]KYC62087.1 Hydroxymethylpyrimidine phosphate kinase ThiD [Heyndrickxia coagulans]KYC65902.1 Hydroxymethylpyrimidine phosphate kinase ThiD [Heyndrickxia coagulans]MCR2847816.1 bifunctional hydroxymethylpyrimi